MGLPYVPLYVVFPRGKEAIALRVALQRPLAWAYVAQMWCGVAQNAPSGVVEGPAAVAQLEEWAGWDGDPGQFVEALCLPHVGLLDHTDRGFRVHNWDLHCGAHIDRLERDRKRKADARAKTTKDKSDKRPGTVRGRSEDKTRKSADEHEGEQEQEQELIPHDQAGALAPRPVSPFVAFLRETYPDIRDPWKSEAAWLKAYPGVDLLAEGLKARSWEVAQPNRAKKNHGAFLNRWFSNATPAPAPKPPPPPLPAPDDAWLDMLPAEDRQRAREAWDELAAHVKRSAYADALPRLMGEALEQFKARWFPEAQA